MGLFSRARQELGFAYIANIGRDYGPGAKVATHTTASLVVHFELPSVTPEMMLFALRQDDDVRRHWELSAEIDARIEAAALERKEKAPDLDGWSRRSRGATNSAWARARARGSKIGTRGDLLSGLAGTSGLPGQLLREAELDYGLLDGDEPPVDLEKVVAPEDPGEDETLWVVAMDDDKTTMMQVTTILRECFGCTEPRAMHLMYSTHFFGVARVAEMPFAAAKRRVERATASARAQGAPFELRIVAPPSPPTGRP